MKVKLFKSDKNKQWYFHFIAGNGRIVAQSEGYKRRASAVKAVDAITEGGLSSWRDDQRCK